MRMQKIVHLQIQIINETWNRANRKVESNLGATNKRQAILNKIEQMAEIITLEEIVPR